MGIARKGQTMTTEATPGNVPLSDQLGPANEAQPRVGRAAFEAWFISRYRYTRAVLTNQIWASEIKAAAEAFEAGRAEERERWAIVVAHAAAELSEIDDETAQAQAAALGALLAA